MAVNCLFYSQWCDGFEIEHTGSLLRLRLAGGIVKSFRPLAGVGLPI